MNTNGWEAGCAFLNEKIMRVSTPSLSFRVLYWDWQPLHYSNQVHRHSYYEVCFVLSGEGEYQDDETVFALHPGSMFASRPGIWHQIRSQTGLNLMYVAYELDKNKSQEENHKQYGDMLDSATIFLEDAFDKWTAHYWLGLYAQAATLPYDHADEVRAMAAVLLAGLLRPFAEDAEPSGVRSPAKRSKETRSAIVRLTKQFVRDNLSRPLRLEDVAGYLNVSARQLSRLFQLEGDDTFVVYVRNERLRNAELLLKTTIHSLKEVAEMSGFQSVHYFTAVFAEQLGIPPGEYRKRHMAEAGERIAHD